MSTMDSLCHEIQATWGDGKLVPVPPEQVPVTAISPSSKALLTKVGLPARGSDLIIFPRDERLLRPVTVAGVEYHTLAQESGGPVALKAGTDEVWALDTAGSGRPLFVNTHPGFLLLFLGVLLPLVDQLRDQEPQEVNARIDEVAARFAVHDPAALADPDSWWPTVLVEAREGFL
jgi:hypothetical protein